MACNCCFCFCCNDNGGGSQSATLIPIIAGGDTTAKTIDSTGSIGDFIRLVIKDAAGTILETTPSVANTGTNTLSFTSNIDNGYVLCLQVSNDNNFSGFVGSGIAQTEVTIPTPNLGFNPIP